MQKNNTIKNWLTQGILITTCVISITQICHAIPTLYETYDTSHPEIGKNGAVATQEAHATKVGLDILKKGGNAIDAAVAIGYALAVTLPRAGNIGGGGFMTIWLNKEQKAYVINYREKAPHSISINEIRSMPHDQFIYSYKAAGVPGTVAGLNMANKKFGKLKLPTVINPAIKLAENGFPISRGFLDATSYSKDILNQDILAKQFFLNKQLQINAIFKQPELAKTLKLIAKHGDAGFYSGETANLITKAVRDNHGYITKNDLKTYTAELVEPIISTYRNYKIITPPPPSSGGPVVAEILNILEALNIHALPNNSADYFHFLTESFNLAYIDRNYNLGDPKFGKNNLDKMISKDYAKELAKTINTKNHIKTAMFDQSTTIWHEGKNTTHYTVIDKDLNVVSNTYTLNLEFGAGKIIPGTGFFINNELDDFTINLGEKNSFNLIQGEKNLIAANKQPLSSMAPTIVLTNNNQPYLATGSPGGSKIITAIVQVILNTIDRKLNVSSALAMPRIHSQFIPDELQYENGISNDSLEILKKMGHKTKLSSAMGSAQSIVYNDDYMQAAADLRRSGALACTY